MILSTICRNESEIVSEILKRILSELQDESPINLSHLTKWIVGMESRVNEVIRILNMESDDEVQFIGICGMSGIGKTILAKVVFECIRNTFQESSFIGNVKDVSKEHDSDLCGLQQKILDDDLKDESIPVRSVKHGQTMSMTKLRDLKVIIVLDDVNHADQFMYLAGEEALRLFSQSALQDGRPMHGYEKLSDNIVKYIGHLLIALTLYGSLLCGQRKNTRKRY
ncbi:disease resistance-like protein DSC1 [Bidens hawaiensis]|uniref:disease resistance-like protein DSC1 n=1 Tax=Bidens hawaiensis TaxID=980011 RepID=UPI00404AF738